jgi:hypothetical protein
MVVEGCLLAWCGFFGAGDLPDLLKQAAQTLSTRLQQQSS